ncbi:MAG: Asp23/Gls24 family envelope stress response protein [Candidatus Bipolaricaulota bacterium]|nr:Asp23/Gls24 family envelope stress response protein [Candidatus Bipolaricaulota bacterium]
MARDEETLESPAEGQISISRDVIATIAGLAAGDVDGVAPPRGGAMPRGDAVRRLVDVELSEGRVRLTLRVGVLYGHRVQEVSQRLQTLVKEEVERMTALPVDEVNVEVVRVVFPEDGRRKGRPA